MSEIKNRELSQFSSFLHVDNINQNIGIASGTTPFIGIGTVNALSKVHVVGNVQVAGIVTATEIDVTTLTIGSASVGSGSITILDGASLFYSGVGTITNLRSSSGIVTNLSGTAVTYTTARFNTTNTSLGQINSGIITTLQGSTISYSGISTFNNVLISSGIITSTNPGVTTITYYGDGSKLDGISAKIGIKSDNVAVGYGVSLLNFTGTSLPSVTVDSVSGIATVNIPALSIFANINQVIYRDNVGFYTGSNNFTFNENDLNVTGVITATTFNGNVTGNVTGDLTGVASTATAAATAFGLSGTPNIVVGIITCVDINSTSDITLKDNISTVENALNIVSNLRGVRFNWKDTNKSSLGIIAQELEHVLPELVTDTDPKTVNYNGIIAVLIESIKELQKEVKELKGTK